MYEWLNDKAITFLSRGYIEDCNFQRAIDRINEIINRAEDLLPNISMKPLYEDDYKFKYLRKGLERGWFSFSSPIWSNFGTNRGLPAACNGSLMEDDIHSIIDTVAEIGKMTANGAGTSCYMNNIRPAGSIISSGGNSGGPLHFAKLIQETVSIISQSNIRRGNCAIWLDIEHQDIDDWLNIRSITEGIHHSIQHLSFGVCISNKWMNEMLNEQKGGEKRLKMVKIINRRRASGYPYIFFTDNANKDIDTSCTEDIIRASNLCTEIMLPSNDKESFVCVLSSLNLEKFDEWKDNEIFVQEAILFLLTVNYEYIEKAKTIKALEKAVYSASKRNAVGLGVLGYHSYLQRKMIAFNSGDADKVNETIFSFINKAVVDLLYKGIIKNVPFKMLAIAPTTSSSFILGQTSPSIEPWDSNYFENDLAKGVFTQKNKYLEKYLEDEDKNTPEVWNSILEYGGSVQHLSFIPNHVKNVFKTFGEIDQYAIIKQAAARQKFIDQGQSINLKIKPDASKKYNVDLIVLAWRLGLKALYYHKGYNAIHELNKREICNSCEA